MKIDENLMISAAGEERCAHCDALLALGGEPHLSRAIVREVDATALGPQVRIAPERYTPAAIVARLTLCPGCLTQLRVSVGPRSTADHRGRALGAALPD
ncbi:MULTISPECIES: hypothetical protein [Streptomyces]|uniref:Uncharacterized protein n=1 Tax=Streptomyces rhizosphaericus TaxID=114699 RepID=A0A6G4AGS0_9ACTN|nr:MULTISPECIES: hypothetical protein [Streptomyces]NEW72636.1 hypothetical protein [Streptomyces rhizosphaericus]